MTKHIRVTAKKDGFRRGGRAWTGTTTVPADDLTDEQIQQLKGEPMLVVDEVDVPDESGKGAEDKADKPPAKKTG